MTTNKFFLALILIMLQITRLQLAEAQCLNAKWSPQLTSDCKPVRPMQRTKSESVIPIDEVFGISYRPPEATSLASIAANSNESSGMYLGATITRREKSALGIVVGVKW